jgi:serine-type D-Ala-D-Ala carboxypeptidase/endopeptidase (penicillin-binding protein 4)
MLALALLQSQISRPLDDPKLKGAVVAAMVSDLNGKVRFERNADLRVMPASNEKIFTCAFALAQKGKDYRSRTHFWFGTDSIKIHAEGDPTLKTDQIVALKKYVNAENGKKVEVLQAYRVDRPDTWQIGDAANRYAPAIHAFSLDKSGFEVWADSTGIQFSPRRPQLAKFEFVEAAGEKLRAKYDVFQGTLEVKGELPKTRTRLDTLSDPDPSRTAAFVLADQAEYTELKQVPSESPTETIESPALSQIIADCLKPSDNCLAEHLLMIGSGKKNHAEAAKSLTEWLKTSVGLEPWAFRIDDGSGISRKNNTTVRSISKVLTWSAKQPTYQLWQDSLASAGSGTLASRLKGVTFFGKTGTLDMVSALSGYVKCKDGKTRIVSVVLNHYGCSSTDARNLIDRFIENVANN